MDRKDKRVATLATVPARVRSLCTTLRTLRPQVDEIYVFLNGHKEVPECLAEFDCKHVFASEHGDKGDAGKFFWSDQLGAAWNLTCDDDFAYHPGYVDYLVDAAERLQAVVSLHGVVLAQTIAMGQPVSWLRQARKQVSYAADDVLEDVPVHILGTGVCCHHTSLVTAAWSAFPQPHSADVYFSMVCQKKRVRRFVAAHPPDLATATAPPLSVGPKKLRWNGVYSQRVADQAPWILHTEYP